jgi:transposase
VRVFATFTEDLERLTDWLEQCGVTTVALEATGVYWIPLFEILEQRGIRPCLVNARHMKNVPGRRTDWHECQWLQFLHSVGLLRAAFRPGQDICAVRTLLRHRNGLVSAASQHVQHMHKALTQMNLQIHHVISDITGLTGRAIVDAILAGQRDGAELAKLRDPHIKADADTIRKSLEGNWRPEHLFTLGQSRDLYRIYQQQIVNCDLEIEKMLQQFEPRTDPAQRPLPPDRKRNRAGSKRRKKNGHPHPEFDLRTETYKLFGVDVTQIPGLEENALPLFSEVGRDMSTWPSAAHFISWLALCPDNDISGGKVLWRGARKVKNRAGHLFRLAAFSLHHSLTPLGNYLQLPAPHESQARPPSCHHGNRPQDRIDLLHHGQKSSRIRRDPVGHQRRPEGEKVGSKTQTASQTTGLRTCSHRTQGCMTNRCNVREFLGRLADCMIYYALC